MGDRCDVVFKVGGKITHTQALKLIELMESYEFKFNYSEEPTLDNLDEEFEAEEINYGEVDDLTNYCIDEGIAFELRNAAGGGYGAGIQRFLNGRCEGLTADEGEAMIPLSRLINTDTLASGFGNLIALARFMDEPFPNLEVEPAEETTKDSTPIPVPEWLALSG